MAFAVLVLPVVNAGWDWDNRGEYNETTNTMCVWNAFGYGELLGCATLKSPNPNHVGYGEEILVGWFDLENHVELDGEDVWGIMELYDGDWNPLERNYKYKKQKLEEGFKEVCVEGDEYWGNGSIMLECHNETTYFHEWQAFNGNNPVEVGNETIGLFMEVEPNEQGEWIPTLYGIRVEQWAGWTSGLNKDINFYYTMNSTAGIDRDWVNGINNLTTFGGAVTRGHDGIINGSFRWTGGAGDTVETTQLTRLNADANGSISLWVNFTAVALPK